MLQNCMTYIHHYHQWLLKPRVRQPVADAHAWFVEIDLVCEECVHVCVCLCVRPRG